MKMPSRGGPADGPDWPCAWIAAVAHVVAVASEHVEGVQLHFLVMPAGMKRIKIRSAINPQDDRLAIAPAVLQCGFDDPRIAFGPLIA